MKHSALKVLVVAFGWTLLTACGGSKIDGFASSYCDLLKPCCASAGLRTDGAQCRQLISAFGSNYNSTAGDQCLAALRAASQQADYCSGGFNVPACDSAFGTKRGSKKPGESCKSDSDCAAASEGEVTCRSASFGQSNDETCRLEIVGKQGDMPCVGTVEGDVTSYTSSDEVTRGYLCKVANGVWCDSNTKACAAIPRVGEACASSFASYGCTEDARCDTTIGKCVARTPLGSMCSGTRDECAQGAYCDGASTKCTATRSIGTACSEDDQCASGNCADGKCANDGFTTIGLTFVCGES